MIVLRGAYFQFGMLQGEIETIASVSPTGRYIVLLIDDNGQLDLINWCAPISTSRLENARFMIFDREREAYVYSTELLGEEAPRNTFHQMQWVSDDELMLYTTCDAPT